MLTTTYHQTAIDTTGVEEANRLDLLEALALESQMRATDVKSIMASFKQDEQLQKEDWSLVALVAIIAVVLIWAVVFFAQRAGMPW